MLSTNAGDVRVWRDILYFTRPLPAVEALPAGRLLHAEETLELLHGTLRFESCPADAPDAIAHDTLRLEFRHGGEVLTRRGRQVDLSEAFAAAGVAPWWRAGHPLLYAGEALVAVPGVAVASAEPDGAPGTAWRAVWVPADPAAALPVQS